jgi:hypothetical protein
MLKNKRIAKADLFRCPDHAKAPGLFHVIHLDEFIGWRNGLIIERAEGETYGVHLILSVMGLEKREFIFYLDRQRSMDFPVHWLRISYLCPKSFGWPDDWRRLRLANFIGSIQMCWGTSAMQHL